MSNLVDPFYQLSADGPAELLIVNIFYFVSYSRLWPLDISFINFIKIDE
jgi:hypothetical protein